MIKKNFKGRKNVYRTLVKLSKNLVLSLLLKKIGRVLFIIPPAKVFFRQLLVLVRYLDFCQSSP